MSEGSDHVLPVILSVAKDFKKLSRDAVERAGGRVLKLQQSDTLNI
jgi:hypothetical protein